MSETVNNSKSTFKNLMNGIIATTVVTFVMALVLVILVFTLAATATTEGGVFAVGGITLVFSIISIICNIAWIICVAIALVKVSDVKQHINPTHFRIEFGIFLGLYVLFWIIGIFVPIIGSLQTVDLIVALVFAIIHKNKLK